MAHEVLIVEDDDDNGKLMQLILKKQGYDIQWCKDGETAVDYCKEHSPKLILMDLTLPGINGFEASKQLRENGTTSQTPIIVITAHTMEETKNKVRLSNLDYLPKPFTPDQLRQIAQRYIKD